MGLAEKYIDMRIVSAEPENTLTKILDCGVELRNIMRIDYLTMEIRIQNKDVRTVCSLVKKCGGTYHIIGRGGALWNLQILLHRPVLGAGLILFFLVALLVNGRIFFIHVEGNELCSEQQIVSVLEDCGIIFGSKAALIRSETVKNSLLQQLPQLQWVGITTSGSVATIHVQERSIQNPLPIPSSPVSSIVALRDGIVSKMIVYKGNSMVQVGQSVQSGDILVSGYTDYSIAQKGERAEAEVYAYTSRQQRFIFPLSYTERCNVMDTHTCYRVRIGKKVINLCNHSGISNVTCVKMYEEDYWTLPGGFQLPLSVIKVQLHGYTVQNAEHDAEVVQSWLPQFADSYVSNQMIAGSILHGDWCWGNLYQAGYLDVKFDCHEMIGQVKDEETTEQNAEDY